MYNVSTAFRSAVQRGEHQIALLIFDDAFFSNADINIENGITLNSYFNVDEDLAIGQTPSDELTFSLFNDTGLLNTYGFGEFTATIGVKVAESTYAQNGTCTVSSGRYTYVGNSRYPYLTRNNSILSRQPGFAVRNMLAYKNNLYVFGESGQCLVYTEDATPTTTTLALNSFMKDKVSHWMGVGYYYNPSTRLLTAYEGGTRSTYEFCPLGVFSAIRPNVAELIEIEFTCNDQMTKFDVDMPSLSYPTTIGGLYAQMCDYLGVQHGPTNFLNSSVRIETEPEEFQSATMRDVLKWIAEAAGSNAHFDRDGVLQMVWLRNTTVVYDEHDYSDFQPYWYQTPKVNQICNRDTDGIGDETYGQGKNVYLIQNNPFFANPKST
ncbi:MAG: hypothetical protein J6N19_03050 [Clostridium sp.]|nr:hypothetical protein [Clostridium sp.]